MLKTVNIVATAAFPWRTGTAILALYRAFYLAQRGLDVKLYVPWLASADQEKLFGEHTCFNSFTAQEECIRAYLPADSPSLDIEFYPAKYKEDWGVIHPTCQISQRLRCCDWLILEEPEHLNWKHPWSRYEEQASRVTGIVLTNYWYFWNQGLPGMPFIPWLLERYNRWLIRRHCDDIILLGRAFPRLPRSQHLNVTGIHPSFFTTSAVGANLQGLYFMGKLLWGKGFRELVDLLSMSEIRKMDVYGIGKDREAIDSYAREKGITFHFKGISTDPASDLKQHKIFVNVSRSETICSTTAEALVQGKFVIIPAVPGNDAFYQFKNCLVYSSPQEFTQHLQFALEHTPEKDLQVKNLSWEAATDRLLTYYEEMATITKRR